MDRYSPLKALRYHPRLTSIKAGIVTPPVHVQVILSDLCNQACHFCAYRDPSYTSSVLFHDHGNYNPNRKLPREKVIEILDDCQEMGAKGIQFTGGGEPTVHPDFQEIVDYTSTLGLKWALVTNGVLLNKYDASNAEWIRVSLDAATKETYAKIRQVPNSHFDRACDAIREYGCGVGFVMTEENWHEVYDATVMVKSLGASNIRIGAQFSSEGNQRFAGFRQEAHELCLKTQTLSDAGFDVVNRFDEKLEELDQGRPEYSRCGYQYFTTYIGADQNLYRCCVYAYNPRGLIASIQGRRFREVWAEHWGTLARFDARGCERCQFNAINRAIDYSLADSALHDAFV